MKTFKLAIIDLYNGVPNEGHRCIVQIVNRFSKENKINLQQKIFYLRDQLQIPSLNEYDAFISTGGPGSPIIQGLDWEKTYFYFLDQLMLHNKTEPVKKLLLGICHSFQLLVQYFDLAKISKRKSTSFGVMPVHLLEESKNESLFLNLENPFFAVDSRDYQAIEANFEKMLLNNSKILALEKYRPHIPLERAIMAIRFTPEIIGTQFHPEADAEGMRHYLTQTEKKEIVIQNFGKEKYLKTIEELEEEKKIKRTEATVIPNFIKSAYQELQKYGKTE